MFPFCTLFPLIESTSVKWFNALSLSPINEWISLNLFNLWQLHKPQRRRKVGPKTQGKCLNKNHESRINAIFIFVIISWNCSTIINQRLICVFNKALLIPFFILFWWKDKCNSLGDLERCQGQVYISQLYWGNCVQSLATTTVVWIQTYAHSLQIVWIPCIMQN